MANDKQVVKITAKLFSLMHDSFEAQLKRGFISRDAFLDHVISAELKHMEKDLYGLKLSAKANRYISGQLKNLGRADTPELVTMTIKLRKETADALNELVNLHNLVRDALLNRIVMMLRSNDAILKRLDIPTRINSRRMEGVQDMPVSPMGAILETMADPFYYLRAACEQEYECGLYVMPLPEGMDAFACYLPDSQVPKTAANERRIRTEAEEDAMFESIFSVPGAEKSHSSAKGAAK